MDKSKYTQLIKTKAAELGFSYVGIAKADFLGEEAPRLERWLQLGMNGKMSYMNNWFDKRLDPRKLVDGAKSVICLMHNYYTDKQLADSTGLRIAKYAQGKDYHWVLKKKLNELVAFINSEIGEVNGRAFVDSGPVLEKAWAARAGLGWIGKNSLLLNRKSGSFFFLAELILDLELEYDNPIGEFCANCRRCADACPTGAIVEPRIVDARRCISYFTIEYKGELPSEMSGKFKNWIFGCDICQDACPWNRKSTRHSEPLFDATPDLLNMTARDWHEITRSVFNKLFKGTAVTRAQYQGLKRNIKFIEAAAPKTRVNDADASNDGEA